HDAAEGPAALDVGVGGGRLGQGVGAVDDHRELAGGDGGEVAGDEVVGPGAAEDQLGAEEHAGEALVARAHGGDVEGPAAGPAGVADGDHAPAVGQAPQALLEGLAPDGVDDDVGAPAVGQPPHLGDEVGPGVVDAVVEPEGAQSFEL